jgi:hypothetical protein
VLNPPSKLENKKFIIISTANAAHTTTTVL